MTLCRSPRRLLTCLPTRCRFVTDGHSSPVVRHAISAICVISPIFCGRHEQCRSGYSASSLTSAGTWRPSAPPERHDRLHRRNPAVRDQKVAKHAGRAQRGWFGAITATIYVVSEGARAEGLYSAPIRTTFKALKVPKDVRS